MAIIISEPMVKSMGRKRLIDDINIKDQPIFSYN